MNQAFSFNVPAVCLRGVAPSEAGLVLRCPWSRASHDVNLAEFGFSTRGMPPRTRSQAHFSAVLVAVGGVSLKRLPA